ncbi:putative carboxylesterase 15, partial [Quercus suber]
LYSGGSISRSIYINFNIPVIDDGSVLWKDYVFKKHHNLHLRLCKPTLASLTKLHVLYYIHAGGFCFGSRTFPNFHNICHRLASGLGVLVVAPDYRLVPEHRLPAAIDDAMSSLKWLQTLAMHGDIACDTWLGDGTRSEEERPREVFWNLDVYNRHGASIQYCQYAMYNISYQKIND